jgi:hypothetical protein
MQQTLRRFFVTNLSWVKIGSKTLKSQSLVPKVMRQTAPTPARLGWQKGFIMEEVYASIDRLFIVSFQLHE